jgi:hypothetical protein
MWVCDRNASGARRIAPNAFLSIDETGLVTIVASGSEMANVPMPLGQRRLRPRMITGLAHGYSQLDWSALGLIAAEAAGIGDQADAK